MGIESRNKVVALFKQSSVFVKELSADSHPAQILCSLNKYLPEASRANMLVLRTSNFQGAAIRHMLPIISNFNH